MLLTVSAGQEDYDSTRQLSYARTDMFMVMFSVDSKMSLDNVEHKWIPDILKFIAHEEDKSFHYKYVLIGTKIGTHRLPALEFTLMR